jgi:repressor of nif and glnA expression
MQITRTILKSAGIKNKFTEKEIILLSEIGLDQIPAATNFVQYFSQRYNISESGIWYTLKKLKRKRVVDFTEKGEAYKPLSLTDNGITILRQKGALSKTKLMNNPITSVGGL